VRLDPYDNQRVVDFVQTHVDEKVTISEILRVCIHIGLDKLYESEIFNETQEG
jgi:hypothetical protein